ncbi:MAG: EF-Tu/IF-2/RF-3 family GTPase [Haloechinothrix sp.]
MTPEVMPTHGRVSVPSAPIAPTGPVSGFRLVIEKAYSISGRGTIATGRVEGTVHADTMVSIERDGQSIGSSKVKAIERFGKSDSQTATGGENIGLLLAGLKREDIRVGDVLTADPCRER